MTPAGALQVAAAVKEPLLEELRAQARSAGIETRPGRAERIERTEPLAEHYSTGTAAQRESAISAYPVP